MCFLNSFSIVHWHSPVKESPEEASYILIRQNCGDGYTFCSEAAYENGLYWYLFPDDSVPIKETTITGWAYFPYDNHKEIP